MMKKIIALLGVLLIAFLGMEYRVDHVYLKWQPKGKWKINRYLVVSQLSGSIVRPQEMKSVSGAVRAIYNEELEASEYGISSYKIKFDDYLYQSSQSETRGTPGGRGGRGHGGMPGLGGSGGLRGGGGEGEGGRGEGEGGGKGGEGGGGGNIPGIGGGGGGLPTPPGGEGKGKEGKEGVEESLDITPLTTREIFMTVDSQGNILQLDGLDVVKQYAVEEGRFGLQQMFEYAHCLRLPDRDVYITEQWKNKVLFTLPTIETPLTMELTYRLVDITPYYLWKSAVIEVLGQKDFKGEEITEKKEDNKRIKKKYRGNQSVVGRFVYDFENGRILEGSIVVKLSMIKYVKTEPIEKKSPYDVEKEERELINLEVQTAVKAKTGFERPQVSVPQGGGRGFRGR